MILFCVNIFIWSLLVKTDTVAKRMSDTILLSCLKLGDIAHKPFSVIMNIHRENGA